MNELDFRAPSVAYPGIDSRWGAQEFMQQSMYSPTYPTAGQPGGLQRGYLGLFCLFKPLGCGGFLKFCPQAGITELFNSENPSDYSNDCYKIKIQFNKTFMAIGPRH